MERDQTADDESESSESVDDEGLRRQVLEVDGEPDYASGPPMDGFEYLRRVAYEARQSPDIMRAENLDASVFSTQSAGVYAAKVDEETELAPPDWAKPNREWTRRTVGDFSDLRIHVSRMLASTSTRNCSGASGTSAYPRCGDRRAWEKLCAEIVEPPIGAVLAMDAVTCAHLLRHVSHALCRYDYDGDNADFEEIIRLLRWFHALCARVDLPLDPDTEAGIRSAMKGVARGRLSVVSGEDALVAHFNLAIAIGGGYFKQWRE